MSIALEDIGGSVCEPAAGVSKVFYAEHSDFVTIKDTKKLCDDNPANVAANYEDLAEIEGDHVFKQGKCFKEIKAITNTGAITSTQVGENERHLFDNEFGFEIADSTAKVLGFQRFVKNKKFVFLVEEFGSGRMRQIGWSRLGALISAQVHSLEATTEGKNSATVTVKDTNFGPAPIYKGAVLLTPMV